MIEDTVDILFHKQFRFNEDHYNLPDINSMFRSPPWHIEELHNLKDRLNNVKSKLNDYNIKVWHNHTSQRYKAGRVQWYLKKNIKPELLTQAWCKFYEHLSSFPLLPDCVENSKTFTSVHLCEAPGAFITSLNHWLKINKPAVKWDWLATTLNPYYEGNSPFDTVNDDRFIFHTLNNWYFGVDDTGDIMKLDNIEALIEMAKEKVNLMLVTADGSIHCMHNPGEQELIVSHLQYCEVLTALSTLEAEGTFILKIFTIFEYQTVCLIYLLLCLFQEVHVKKPATSKEGNSEVYLVCLKFKGQQFASPYMEKLKEHWKVKSEAAMFKLEDIPASFIKQIYECSKYFMEFQCTAITDNITSFEFSQSYDYLTIKKIRELVAREYIRRCNLRELEQDAEKIVKDVNNCKHKFLNWSNYKYYTTSFNEICKKESMDMHQRLMNLFEEIQSVEISANYYTLNFTNDYYKLSITKGAPYEKITNSKFCTRNLSQKLAEFQEIVEKLNAKTCFPLEESINSYKANVESSSFTSVQFDYNAKQSSWEIFDKIHDAFNEINEGQDLILFGYCLLSRFNVGLLFILSHAFASSQIELNEVLGCVIVLRGKKISKSVSGNLNQIADAIKNTKCSSLSVLSVVEIPLLCDDDFYTAIVESNAWIIKSRITNTALLQR